MAEWIAKYARAAADLLLPRLCVVCDCVLLPSEEHICSECLGDLPLTRFELLSRNPMADRYNEGLRGGDESRYCYASALFHYREGTGYDRITQALKYRRNFAAGRFFARMLGERLSSAAALFGDVDLIVPVPLHPWRLWKRGYNQSETIARELRGYFAGAELDTRLLVRSRRTGSQTRLGTEERRANVAGAFKTRKPAGGHTPRHILLVDDVFTSGSTLIECHKALRAALGAEVRISAATLAFVEKA